MSARDAPKGSRHGSCSSPPAAPSCCSAAPPSWTQSLAVGGRRCCRARAVAAPAGSGPGTGSSVCAGWPTAAGSWRPSGSISADTAAVVRGDAVWLRWKSRCRPPALDAAGPWRSACRAAARACAYACGSRLWSGRCPKPRRDENGSRTALGKPRKCAVVPRTFRGAASLSEQPARAPVDDAGRLRPAARRTGPGGREGRLRPAGAQVPASRAEAGEPVRFRRRRSGGRRPGGLSSRPTGRWLRSGATVLSTRGCIA